MHDLEKLFGDWRVRISAALPLREEAVAELEMHLRDHVRSLQREGKSIDEAFAIAQRRLGKPQALASEFHRIPQGWWPALILLPLLGFFLAFFFGIALWTGLRRGPITGFQLLYLGTFFTGYFGVVGSGLIALSALVATLRRPLGERERCAVRRLLKKLTWVAMVSLPIGAVFGTAWFAQLSAQVNQIQSNYWPYRLVLPVVSVGLLFYAQSRPAVSDRRVWLTGISASLVLLISALRPSIRLVDIDLWWLWAVFLLGQVLLILLRFPAMRTS